MVAAGTVAAAGGVPQNLVGTWGKAISATTWQKNHVYGEPAGPFAITITTSGLTNMLYNGSAFTSMHATVSHSTLTFGPTADNVCSGRGVYHWAASPTKLHLTVVKDDCGARKVLMTTGAFVRKR